jgi:hypothetical protein
MKIVSVDTGLVITLGCFLGIVTAGYGQSASAQGPSAPQAADVRQEAIRANPQAAAIARREAMAAS